MLRCSFLIFTSLFCSGLLSAQQQVRETRLLAKTVLEEDAHGMPFTSASGTLGSKLFVYSRFDPTENDYNLFRIEENEEVPVLNPDSVGGYMENPRFPTT